MMKTLKQEGVSNWLTNLHIKALREKLTKQEFWDAMKIIYNWLLERIHALFCKKGSFIMLIHIEAQGITSELLDEVCVDVRKETVFQEFNYEKRLLEVNKRKNPLSISVH